MGARAWVVLGTIAGCLIAPSACELVVGSGNYSSGDDGGTGDDASGSSGIGTGSSGSSTGGTGSNGASSSGGGSSNGTTSSGGSSSGTTSGGGSTSGATSSGSSGAGSSSGGGGSSASSSGGGSSGGTCTYPAGASCSVDPQCGCPAGDKCDIGESSAAACTTAGSGTEGMACASNTDCAAGLSCASGVCHTYCTTAGADCSAGVCVQVGDGSQIQDKLCTVDCTLSPDSCGSGQTCVPFVVDDSPVSGDCEAPGSVAFDGSCTSLYDCAAGLACITEYGVCLPWCQTTSFCQSALGDSYNCYFDVSVTIEGTTYGYCD